MPKEYKTMDIAKWVLDQCKDQDQLQRVGAELLEFQRRNMMDLLRWLKYFVDYCRDNKILWGVGRGSSVASYVLYLIGVHKIDPLKYNLDWQDFLR
jgi:DNA polymerase-3 subunit alpha